MYCECYSFVRYMIHKQFALVILPLGEGAVLGFQLRTCVCWQALHHLSHTLSPFLL
jgi:hypothetical protein